MKKLCLPLLILYLAVVPALAEEVDDIDQAFPKMAERLSAAAGKLPQKTAAVYGFDVIGRPGDTYARYCTEKLTHEIVSLGKLVVIERARIDEVLKEQNFALSGVVDAGMAARIGKVLAVDAVITGTILVNRERTEFIVRIVQSESAVILASVNIYSSADDEEEGDPTAAGDEDEETEATLSVPKTRFKPTEKITVSFAGLPGNEHDWITLVAAAETDDTYGEYTYTNSQKSGSFTFAPVEAGEYEIRLYFDWPAGGYEVQKRIKITVK